MSRCQYMTACQGAEEPAFWCGLPNDHDGDHDMIEAECTCREGGDTTCAVHGLGAGVVPGSDT